MRGRGYGADSIADLSQARVAQRPGHGPYSVVFIGIRHGERPGTSVDKVKAEWPLADVVVVGDAHSSDTATPFTHGAVGYVSSPADVEALAAAVQGVSQRGRHSHSHSHGGAAPRGDHAQDAILADPLTRAVFAKADRAAAVNSTVLITGETGTGKEVLARRIHRHSARERCNFVPVNCGSLPDGLIESELFGFKKGAFTGALSDTHGLIEEADGGTLFLDEIGEAPLSMQVRLLRFLDNGEIRPVGGRGVRHPDVRVVAATNRCLSSAVREERFRSDLFFRLGVITIHLPPLRERRGDISPLAHYHVRRAASRVGLPLPTISDDALAVLERHAWPGNVRELQNVMEQAVVQHSSGTITPADLPASVRSVGDVPALGGDMPGADGSLIDALRQHNGNHTVTAAALGISRSTLWRRLRRLEVAEQHR
jgi:DNA-binding NtrC family response regulator